jgi:hypothetical protein
MRNERATVLPPGERMHGRLRRYLAFWATLNCTLVTRWVSSGFDLRFQAGPPTPYHAPNHRSAVDNAGFIDKAVAELLSVGAARVWEGSQPPICISPLGAVPKAGGNLRMILDLRHVNSFLTVPSFRYEGLEAVANVLAPGDYMITLDLHAGYHHVDMNDAALPYLGFAWAGRHYVFQSLPFGLAPAPWAFTTLTRTLLRCWRAAGIKCLGYIDDFLFAAPSADSLLDALHAVILPTLLRAGMLVSWH